MKLGHLLRTNSALVGCLVLTISAQAGSPQPLTPKTMLTLPRLGSAVASPDGTRAVMSVSQYDESDNKSRKNLRLLNLKDDQVLDLTPFDKNSTDADPAWLDKDTVVYVSSKSGSKQLWTLKLADGKAGETRQLTNFSVPVSSFRYSAGGNVLVFSASVYPNMTFEQTKARDAEEAKRPDSAMVFDELFVRHWDEYISQKRSQLFATRVVADNAGGYRVEGEARNLLANTELISPVAPFGDAGDYSISPDGKQVAFVAKFPGRDKAWSTKQDVYTVLVDGSAPPVSHTVDNQGACSAPVFSPRGTHLAWLQMKRPKYEADRNQITVLELASGKTSTAADSWDRSPSRLVWTRDESALIAQTKEHGRQKLFSVPLAAGNVTVIVNEHTSSGAQVLEDGRLLFVKSSTHQPSEVFTVQMDGSALTQHTKISQAALTDVDMSKAEEVWFTGAKGERVMAWMLKPFGFDPAKKYPMAFIIHGGPQSSVLDSFGYRWNNQIFAAAGYVVMAVNFHGSDGYGQAFTDSINKNWGSYPFEDMMKGIDYALETYPYIDQSRIAGLGASYGGYSINWINGHTDRFACLVNHDGKFSTVSGYFGTDELYFPEYDMGGLPWEKDTTFETWDPSRFVQNWKTPTLVIHGSHDYRIDIAQGLSTFTALQRQNVPSRLVLFPDENHWVSKAGNSMRWHKEVLDWINHWTSEQNPRVVKSAPVLRFQKN